jgi:hypothetical protein
MQDMVYSHPMNPAPRIPGLRMQYHLRDSAQGVLAWDVHALIGLAWHLPVVQWPLARIAELDENHWFAHGELPSPRALVAHWQLADAADLRFPILLSAEGRVMDGMHRCLKALRLGHMHIAARQFPVTPPPDAVGVHPDELPYD